MGSKTRTDENLPPLTRCPPFAQQLLDRGMREGRREGKLEGIREAKRDVLLRLVARAGVALTEPERTQLATCTDVASLDRWLDNVLGAKTAADLFS